MDVHSSRIRHPLKVWLISTLLVAGSIHAFSPAAYATFYYPNYGSSWNHNCDDTPASECVSWHFAARRYEYFSLTANMVAASDYAINSVYNPLDILYILDPGNSDSGYFDSNYGTTGFAIAWGSCEPGATYIGSDATHTRDCSPDDVRYNLSYTTHYDTVSERRGVACHETGHIFGLRHNLGTASCMHNTPGAATTIIQGEKDLLNGNY